MTLAQIKELFNQVITESKFWSKFRGSEFVNYLVIFVAQVYFRANQVAARRLQEAFLSLAVKMSSVLAHAESRGYVARKRIPSKIRVTITNSGSEVKYVAENTPLYSSDNNKHYLIREALTVPVGGAVTINVVQAELQYFEVTVDAEVKFLTKRLDVDTSRKIAELDIYITEPNSPIVKWESTHLFRNTNSVSNAYVEFYSTTQQTGVRFGNGISGKIPPLGSVITMKCLITDGVSEIAAGQTLEFLDDTLSALAIVTGETMVSGADREDIETLRANAMYHTNYDNNVVFDNDYAFFTKRSISGLTWFRVWGEKQQEALKGRSDLDFIGKVYLSAYHPQLTQAALMEQLKKLYSNVKELNIEHVPVACNEDGFTLTLSGKILSTNNVKQVKNVVINVLQQKFSHSASKHDGLITYNQIWDAVQKIGLLTSFKIDVNTDLDVAPHFDTFRYLDVAGSNINISY